MSKAPFLCILFKKNSLIYVYNIFDKVNKIKEAFSMSNYTTETHQTKREIVKFAEIISIWLQ